jgi:hypothetical protein
LSTGTVNTSLSILNIAFSTSSGHDTDTLEIQTYTLGYYLNANNYSSKLEMRSASSGTQTVNINQTTAGANHVEVVNSAGSPNSYSNPLHVLAQITDSPGDNIVVVANNNGTVGSTNPLYVEVANDVGNAIPIKTTGTDTVVVSIGQATTQNHVEIVDENGNAITSANPLDVSVANTPTVKIDQVTAGANHIQLVDKTNSAHVAKVSNNGSVHTVITNDVGSEVPISGTVGLDTGYVDNSSNPILNIKNPTNLFGLNVPLEVNLTNTTGGVGIVDNGRQASVTTNFALKVDGSAVTQPVSIAGSPTVKITDGTNNAGVSDISGTKYLNAILPVGNNPITPSYTSTVLTSMPTTTVTGTVTSNISATNNAVKITDGTDTALVDGSGNLQVKLSDNGFKIVDPVNPLNAAFVDSSGNLQVEVNNFPATQAVSLASVPTHAVTIDTSANSVKLTDGTYTADVLSDGSLSVTTTLGNNIVTPLFVGISDGGALADVTPANALKVDGSAVTQPISGSVSVSNTPAVTLSGTSNSVKITDGTDTALVDTSGNLHVAPLMPDVKSTYVSQVPSSAGAVYTLLAATAGKAYRVYSVSVTWTSAVAANCNLLVYSGTTTNRTVLASRLATSETRGERQVAPTYGTLCPVNSALVFTLDNSTSTSQFVFHIAYSEE